MIDRAVIACSWLGLTLCGLVASAATPLGDTYVLVVSGIARDPNERVMEDRVVAELRGHLLQRAGVRRDRLTVLVPSDSACRGFGRPSTAEELGEAIDALAKEMAPTDRFLLYYIGQANAVAEMLRLNLPGPDMTHEQLAARLAHVKAGTQAVVLDCPCAATAAKALAAPARIVVCAATEQQAYGTRFSLHFVPALARAATDANEDGRISLLEGFTTAAQEIEWWYRQMKLIATETPCLEDDGDGVPSERPWRFDLEGRDGRRAAEFIMTAVAGGNDA